MTSAPETVHVTEAATRFLPGGEVTPVADHPWLVSVTSEAGRFSVRQLDPRLSSVRVDLVHEFLRQPGLLGATRLVAQDRVGTQVFDARIWADGSPICGAIVQSNWNTIHLVDDVPLEDLGRAAESLARFHRTGLNTSILARSPSFKAKENLTAVRRTLDLDERRLAGEIRKESRARRWLSAARPLLTNAEIALEQLGYLREEPALIAHLDLWGSHIVSSPDGEATILDCSTIGAAPAVVDIAQLIARTGGWTAERSEHVLQRYSELFPIPPVQRRILPWLVALDAIPGCGRLLVRAHDERNPLPESERRKVLAAADHQLELLASLATAFVPPPPRKYHGPGRSKPTR